MIQELTDLKKSILEERYQDALLIIIDRNLLLETGKKLLDLTYEYTVKELPNRIDQELAQLSGGKDWFDRL